MIFITQGLQTAVRKGIGLDHSWERWARWENQLEAIAGAEARTRETGRTCENDISEGIGLAIQETPKLAAIDRSWTGGGRNFLFERTV